MLSRLGLLVVVTYLGALAFYSRKVPEPRRLAVFALQRTAVVVLWAIVAFVVMQGIERWILDS